MASTMAADAGGSDAPRLVLQHVLEGHADRVWHASWHPTQKLLATCSGDRTVRVWQRKSAGGDGTRDGSWECVGVLEDFTLRTVRCCEWSPDGRLLACTSFDGKAYVWAVDQPGGRRRRRAADYDDDGYEDDGDDDAGDYDDDEDDGSGGGSGSGSSSSGGGGGGGRKFSISLMATLEGHENEVKACAWSPSGALLATCGRDKSVWLWGFEEDDDRARGAGGGGGGGGSAFTGELEVVAVLHGHEQDVKSVAWHPSREVLVSCSYDDTIKVWGEADGDWVCAATLLGHESTVWGASFSPDGTRMVSVSDDLTALVWAAEPVPDGSAGNPLGVIDLIRLTRCGALPALHTRTIFSCHWGLPVDATTTTAGGANGLIATCGADDAIHVYGGLTMPAATAAAATAATAAVVTAADAASASPSTTATAAASPTAAAAAAASSGGGRGDGSAASPYGVVCSVPRAHDQDVNSVRWCHWEPRLLVSTGDDGLVKIWRLEGSLGAAAATTTATITAN